MPLTPASGKKEMCSPPDASGDGAREAVALDLGHLSRQCMGDKDLEAEVLLLFRVQSATLMESLAQDGPASPAAKADIAHRLKGSAVAVGAFPVAKAAAAVEVCGRAGAEQGQEGPERAVELSQAIADLREAVAQAAAEIDRLHEFP